MDWSLRLLFAAFLILAAAIHGAQAVAMVTGTVFCDQCKDGQRSRFDYPINGVKVRVSCADSNGQTRMSREETTNLLGNYVIRFDGTPNLSNCYAQVSGSEQGSSDCGVAAGPTQNPRLIFRVFNMEMYAVDPLLTQPDKPMSFCPKSAKPVSPAPAPIIPPSAPIRPLPSSPRFRFPRMPRLPLLPSLSPLPPLPPRPPMPFIEETACPHQNWTMPEYKCYWRGLNQDAKVAVVFGPIAGRQYGTNMTLWQGLQEQGDLYKTLLREGTAALLNSYNSLLFPYNTESVIIQMNFALMGSPRTVLLTALRFMMSNSGTGNVTCKFTPCK